jgi:protein ImuB
VSAVPRFAAVVLSGLAIEIARQRLYRPGVSKELSPLAIVVSRPGSAVKGETSLLGNTRLEEVSHEARAYGIRPGQTIAAAKAKLALLSVRVVEESAVRAALVAVTEASLAFGPTAMFEAGGDAGDVVWVDVTGCAHLHAREGDSDIEVAERRMGETIMLTVHAMGHACHVAVADGPKVAAAVARYGRNEVTVVPPLGNGRAMGRLPLAALGLSEDARGWLSKVGARRVSDLGSLPRSALALRLGKDAPRAMALLDGDDRSPLRPFVPPEKPIERLTLEYGIVHHEALLFVVKRLCDLLSARLEGRGKKASKLLLVLEVDHAVSGAPKKDPALPLTLASPLSQASELFAVVKAKLESPDGVARIAIEPKDDGTMDVPVLAMSLEVTEEVRAEPRTADMFVPQAKAEGALPRLVSELSAELGAHAVGVLSLVDTWVTHERSRLVPYRASPVSSRGPSLALAGEEMTRLLPVEKPVSRGELHEAKLVQRREEVEWWKTRGAPSEELVVFWQEGKGERAVRATAWVRVDVQTGDAFLEGWVD